MVPQQASNCFFAPNIPVDSLVADAALHQFEAPNTANDLFRRVFLAKQLSHERKIALIVMAVAPGSTAPGNGSAMCPEPSVALIDAIAPIAL